MPGEDEEVIRRSTRPQHLVTVTPMPGGTGDLAVGQPPSGTLRRSVGSGPRLPHTPAKTANLMDHNS